MASDAPPGYSWDEPELQSPVAPAPKSTPAPKPKPTPKASTAVDAPPGYTWDEPPAPAKAESVFDKNVPSIDKITADKPIKLPSYWDLVGQGMLRSAGSAVEGVASVPGLILDPVDAGIGAITGTRVNPEGYATGVREATGLPKIQDPISDFAVQGASGGLGLAGLAKGLAKYLAADSASGILARELGKTPGRDAVAGAVGGAALGAAQEAELGPVAELVAAFGGGVLGYTGATKFVNAAKKLYGEAATVHMTDEGIPYIQTESGERVVIPELTPDEAWKKASATSEAHDFGKAWDEEVKARGMTHEEGQKAIADPTFMEAVKARIKPIEAITTDNATPLPANDAYGPKSFEHAAADFEDAKAAWNEKEFIKLVKSAQESPDLELRSIADHYWATRTAVETSDVSQFTLPEIDEILDGLTPLTFQTNDIGTIASKTTELLSNLRQQYLKSVGAEDLTSDKAKVFLKEKGFTNKQLYEMPATKAMQTAIDEGYSASGVTKQGPESVGGDEPPTEGPDVVTRLTEALKTAGKAREDQDELYRQARAEKFRKVREAQQPGRGQQAYFDSLTALKGELPKADFEEVGSQFTQREVDDLFDVVLKTKTLTDSGKLNAHTGLMKVLNGTVPTPKELELLGEAFPADFVKEIVAKRGIISKSFGTFGEVWNLPKSAMSTFDLSAPFRQGIGLSNRKEFWKGLGPMVKYAFNPKSYKAMDEWIKTHPTYALAEEAGLAITTTGGKGQSEDIFSSHIAEKIPGYGKIVQGSERAYVGFLNKLRFDTFNALVEQGRAAGIDFDADPKAAKGIANYINVMTGRGGLGKAEPAAGVLNGIFFSPRLISSRLQMLAAPAQAVAGKGFIAELPPELRMEAAKSYAAMTAMYATTLGLASFAGHQVTMDPLSSDFGKIKDGNTRIDAGGGLLQYITVGARALMRQSTSLKSGETRDLTGRGDTPLDTDIKFILNKMHPSLTLIADQQRGTNVVGEPFKWQSALLDRLTPMGIPDIVDTLKEHPNQTGMFYAMLGLLGYGLQNFDENATPGKEEASASPPAGYTLEEVK